MDGTTQIQYSECEGLKACSAKLRKLERKTSVGLGSKVMWTIGTPTCSVTSGS
jgi:hypothetical protein